MPLGPDGRERWIDRYRRQQAEAAADRGRNGAATGRALVPYRPASATPVVRRVSGTRPVAASSRGLIGFITESFAGAWQRNIEVKTETVLTYGAVFRCVGMISSDIAKMRLLLWRIRDDGIWIEHVNTAHSPVLRKPNRYQNGLQFIENWMYSKLIHGNTYVLKARDERNVVAALYVLDPTLVRTLVAPDGAVYYDLNPDDLSGVPGSGIAVPASEVIHDRWNTFYHPLVGLSPISACGLAAIQGINIHKNSALFFGNNSMPGGILTAPEHIDDETAARLKASWEANYGAGANYGKVAVLGDGLSYQHNSIPANDAQLIEQLKLTAETVASTFGVPPYKLGLASPTYNNVEALDQQYYSQCLQIHIEAIERLLDTGLELPAGLGIAFELDDLLRMDSLTKMKFATEAVRGGVYGPNDARFMFNKEPKPGGNTPYLQVQNYSIAALAERDARGPPVTPGAAVATVKPARTEPDDGADGGGSGSGGGNGGGGNRRAVPARRQEWVAAARADIERRARALGRAA